MRSAGSSLYNLGQVGKSIKICNTPPAANVKEGLVEEDTAGSGDCETTRLLSVSRHDGGAHNLSTITDER